MFFARHTARIAYIVFVVTLATATFVEWQLGTTYVHETIYGAWWFVVLMAVLALSSVVIFWQALRRNKPAMIVHIALLTILCGALTTRLIGVQGTMFLREGVRSNMFVLPDGRMARMPFGLTLSSFDILYYPGTEAPMDYCSVVATDDGVEHSISMNKVFSSRGFRFYQSSYTSEGSVLAVNYDPFGIVVSYLGYLLLGVGLLLVLFNPRGRFRTLVKSLSAVVLLFLFTSCSASEDKLPNDVPTLDEVRCMDDVLVLYNDRIVPFNTYASDFATKLTGRESYEGLSAEQLLLGWYSKPELWNEVPCLKLKDKLPDKCNISPDKSYVSLAELFDDEGRYILAPFFNSMNTRPPKAVADLNEKVQLIVMLTSDEALKLFPVQLSDSTTQWLSADSEGEMGVMLANFKYNLTNHHYDAFKSACDDIVAFQREHGGESLPSAFEIDIEKRYNALRITTWLFRLALTFGLLLLIVDIFLLSRQRRVEWLSRSETVLLVILFSVQTLSMLMRTIISGNLPMSSGHETMLFLAWSILLVTIIIRRLMPLFRPMGMLLAGFTLLVAHIGLNNPQITPLMPVLHSPWLSSHVASIMISYALFTIVAINSVAGLVIKEPSQQKRLSQISVMLLYPAVTLLSIGIFIGAVWANESWGRYWAWDPKEVWALITMLVYAVPLHPSLVPSIQRPHTMHIYLLCAFACVLMTYFGVNYLLGGMHSYGG